MTIGASSAVGSPFFGRSSGRLPLVARSGFAANCSKTVINHAPGGVQPDVSGLWPDMFLSSPRGSPSTLASPWRWSRRTDRGGALVVNDKSITGADMSTDSRRLTRKKRSQAIVILAVVVLVPLLAFIVGPAVLKTYDATNRVRPTCVVSSAHSGVDSSRSLKGVGSSTAQVVFETANCGTFVLKWGVSRANQEKIANEVLPGQRYRFDVGAGSFRMHAFLNAVRQAVYVKSFERVSS